jgi:hypothetical protein
MPEYISMDPKDWVKCPFCDYRGSLYLFRQRCPSCRRYTGWYVFIRRKPLRFVGLVAVSVCIILVLISLIPRNEHYYIGGVTIEYPSEWYTYKAYENYDLWAVLFSPELIPNLGEGTSGHVEFEPLLNIYREEATSRPLFIVILINYPAVVSAFKQDESNWLDTLLIDGVEWDLYAADPDRMDGLARGWVAVTESFTKPVIVAANAPVGTWDDYEGTFDKILRSITFD